MDNIISYNEYHIKIMERNINFENKYYAEIIEIGEGHWSSTREGAIELCKTHIDSIPTYREISFQPLQDHMVKATIDSLIKDNRIILIRRYLSKNNYITQSTPVYLEPRFIWYHLDSLKKVLMEKENFPIILARDKYIANSHEYYFAYNADFFNTERAIFDLKLKLSQKQIEEDN